MLLYITVVIFVYGTGEILCVRVCIFLLHANTEIQRFSGISRVHFFLRSAQWSFRRFFQLQLHLMAVE
jgi:hypothetical protein